MGDIILSIPTETWIILAALLFAIYIVAFLGLILFIRRVTRPPDKERLARTSVRIAAFGIDFALIFIINDVLLSIVTGYPSPVLSLILYTGIYAIFSLPFLISSAFFPYLLFSLYLLTPYGTFYFSSSLSIVIIGFAYFLLLESLTGGKTTGKAILRIRTVKRDDNIPISVREGVINAFGKSFLLLWDILAGIAVRSLRTSHTERKQFRVMQHISDVVIVNTRIDDTQPFQFEGPGWWQDNDSKGLDIWEEKNGE